MNALEYGTMIHYVFEKFFGSHDRASFSSMSEKDVEKEVSDLLDGYFEAHFGGEKDKSKRFLYLFYRIKATAVKLVWHLLEEFAQSDFTPVDFELGIGEDIPAYRLELDNGLSLTVRGSVDRVDLCEMDGAKYVRVVDYKTGTKTFNLSDIYYGVNLQMFLYLSAIERGADGRYGGELTPAGVLYMPAVSPSVSADGTADEASVRKKIMEKYTMMGVILDDNRIITAMEHDGKGVYIPVKLSGDKVSSGIGSLATLEELGAIFKRIDVLVSRMAEALYDGEVDALPLKGDYDACEYCAYRAVCLRDDKAPSREGKHMNKAELFAQLGVRGKEDDDGENMDG
jgi:ATP-dependent helicase/nuclease subunit B